MNKIFLQNESGRSMVEMLGVLAVMGILTIGGIAGFNYAMDKSKANDILDGINKRAIALSTYTLLGTNITASSLSAEFPNKIGDSTVALYADNTGFDLIVSGVSEAVCDHVLNNGAKMASEILLKEGEDDRVVWKQGVKSDHTCAEKDNEIVFAFNAALDGTKTADAITCGYCQHKENNTCVTDETCDNGCPGAKPLLFDALCYPCSQRDSLPVDATECAKCSEREMRDNGRCALKECADGQFRILIGSCFSCSHTTAFFADEAECAKCSEREMRDNGTCALPCPDGQFRNSAGNCQSCSYNHEVSTSKAECDQCSNRVMLDEKCVPICSDGQFRSIDGVCILCSYNYTVYANKTECDKCSNRVMLNGKCAKICTDGEFRLRNGDCWSCSTSDLYATTPDKAECDKCSNRFSTTDGYCYLCSYNSAVQADKAECDKCSNRIMLDGKCALSCTDGQFRNSAGNCQSCTSNSVIQADKIECDKCSNRVMLDGKCALSCTDEQFRNSAGACVSCGLSRIAISADATECAKCTEREMLDNGYCCLKDKTKYTNKNVCEKCEGTWDADNSKCS